MIYRLHHILILLLLTLTLETRASHQEPLTQEEPIYPVVILGGGIGALTSALYLARFGIEPMVIQGHDLGGQINKSLMVENWPGEILITGKNLTKKIYEQAAQHGAIFSSSKVIDIDFAGDILITLESIPDGQTKTIQARACIIAMGVTSNHLNIPGEKGQNGYWGKGVSNCATCDGYFYRDKTVAVVGGGDTAILEAGRLANIAKRVHIIARADSLRAKEKKRTDTVLAKDNVEIHYNTSVTAIKGNGEKIDEITLNNKGKKSSLTVDGLFLAIGSKPNSELFQHHIALDEQGYILLNKDQETSRPGVFAIGDIVDPIYKQAISAAGDGAKAAIQAQKYLETHFDKEVFTDKNDARGTLPFKSKDSITSPIIEVTSLKMFKQILESSELPVIVDFYAPWCGPCRALAPYLDEQAVKLKDDVVFLKVNVDEAPSLCQQFKISSMPTVIVLNQAHTPIKRLIGPKAVYDYLSTLDKSTLSK